MVAIIAVKGRLVRKNNSIFSRKEKNFTKPKNLNKTKPGTIVQTIVDRTSRNIELCNIRLNGSRCTNNKTLEIRTTIISSES